jgi:hypothetical protein
VQSDLSQRSQQPEESIIPDSIGIESGRIAVVPMRSPVKPPLGEYCAAIRVEKTSWWQVVVTFRMGRKGWRDIERVTVSPQTGTVPLRSLVLGNILVRHPWLVVGDLGIVCRRSAQGVDSQLSREYSRAKNAVEACRRLGGVYWVADKDFAVAVHVPDLEARYSIIEEGEALAVVTGEDSGRVD